MIAFFAVSVEGAFNTAQAFNWKYKKEKGQCLKSKKDRKRSDRFSQTIACGDIIEPGQKVRLNQDLNCAGTGFTAAITVIGPAVLDLKGHTIIGDGSMDGIVVQGEKAKIKNGKVIGCYKGVVIEGEEVDTYHRIRKIRAIENNDDGFHVQTNSNLLEGNVARIMTQRGLKSTVIKTN